DQTGGRDVEPIIPRCAVRGRQLHCYDLALVETFDVRDLVGVALLDRDLLETIARLPVEGRRWQRDVERNVVVMRGQGLQIGADLIGDMAGVCRTIRSCQNKVYEAMLHQVAADVIRDDRVRDAVLPQFPGGQASALITRAR